MIDVHVFLYRPQVNSFLIDTGFPPRQSTSDAHVTITVIRDQYAPVFSNAPYKATISEALNVGGNVIMVTASDQDQVSKAIQETMP